MYVVYAQMRLANAVQFRDSGVLPELLCLEMMCERRFTDSRHFHRDFDTLYDISSKSSHLDGLHHQKVIYHTSGKLLHDYLPPSSSACPRHNDQIRTNAAKKINAKTLLYKCLSRYTAASSMLRTAGSPQ